MFNMNKIFRNKNIIFCGLISLKSYETEVNLEKYKEMRGLFIENPWDRVKTIFMTDDHGAFHPELIQALDRAKFVGFAGGILGCYVEGKKNLSNYMRTSDAKIFSNFKEAYKMFANYSLLYGGKGFLKYGLKYAVFGGGFSLIASCVELYRNKVGILEHVAGGFGIGAIFRSSLGIKGMISGGIVGSVLGLVYGCVLVQLLKLGNIDPLEYKYQQFALKLYRERAELKSSSEKINKEMLELRDLHLEDPLNAISDNEKKKETQIQT